jgi:branched-chain amino acid transport system substrate-binding protein
MTSEIKQVAIDQVQPRSTLERREFIRFAAATGLISSLPFAAPAIAAGRPVRVGYVTPRTGPLAAFAEADGFVISHARQLFAKGIDVGGQLRPLEIILKDSQSSPNRAAAVASDLILEDKVDLILVASTPETTNPVADQCELNGIPCISTVAPWQPWFFTRGGKPDVGFQWTYHFFWGLEDIIGVFASMWSKVATNKVVGGIWPNDGDGNAWGDPKIGFPPALQKAGFTVVDPGRYPNLTSDFSAQIAAYKKAGVEIVTGVPLPPDFTTFWTQAGQQGFRPRVATVGKALLFPVAVEALGERGEGVSAEVWWSPVHPFKSSLTNQSAADLCAEYEKTTKRQWTQPIGFAHALFEITASALKRVQDLDKKSSIRDAIAATKLDTVVGPVAWGSGPVKNVAKTPLVGGQWRRGGRFKYDLRIVDNSAAPNIRTQGALELIKT